MSIPCLTEETAKTVLRQVQTFLTLRFLAGFTGSFSIMVSDIGIQLIQVEFYFSDSNLPIDDFLKKTVTESEDGCKFLASEQIQSMCFDFFNC